MVSLNAVRRRPAYYGYKSRGSLAAVLDGIGLSMTTLDRQKSSWYVCHRCQCHNIDHPFLNHKNKNRLVVVHILLTFLNIFLSQGNKRWPDPLLGCPLL